MTVHQMTANESRTLCCDVELSDLPAEDRVVIADHKINCLEMPGGSENSTTRELRRQVEALRVQLGRAHTYINQLEGRDPKGVANRLNELISQRDQAYLERARITAFLLAQSAEAGPTSFVIRDIVMTPALDVDEKGWYILFVTIGKYQMSWHISPDQRYMFDWVPLVDKDDPRAQWDGHTTEQKYQWLWSMTMDAVS